MIASVESYSRVADRSKVSVLRQAAVIRAELFGFSPPLKFVEKWFLERLFGHKPKTLPVPVSPTREFCLQLLVSNIQSAIGELGEMIGWEDDHEQVGPIAICAKKSLLRLIPYILPEETTSQPKLYRLVLEHGDFGIHNMSITDDYSITSLFDWETGCIAPAILSDPSMAVDVDIQTDEAASPVITRVPEDSTWLEQFVYRERAFHYLETLFQEAPGYRAAIESGKDARHLWFALRDWRGEEPENYFGALGEWAENRYKELRLDRTEMAPVQKDEGP